MRKNLCSLVFLLFTISLMAQSDDWYIQLGVFDRKADINYFNKTGSNIYYSKDSYGFHRYYKGVYTQDEANKLLSTFDGMGYNTELVHKSDFNNRFCCNPIPTPQSLFLSMKNIFFDFDRSNLRPESKQQLSDLTKIMRDFPSYKVTLRAHTDAKGSNAYNEALSLRRANSAKQYLTGRGIASSRIKTETFGEDSPIAKNELAGGQDTEEGRQFNRRVEIMIMDQDGNLLNEIVDEIDVPSDLKN